MTPPARWDACAPRPPSGSGDTAAVAELTGGLPAATAAVDTPVAARLAVAAGHGQRIAGHTQAALDIFTHVWEHAAGPPQASRRALGR